VKELHAAPWLRQDMETRIDAMSAEEIASVFEASPAGVSLRHRSNLFLPIQAPDLIGLKDRRYFDRSGLESRRGQARQLRLPEEIGWPSGQSGHAGRKDRGPAHQDPDRDVRLVPGSRRQHHRASETEQVIADPGGQPGRICCVRLR
jgi:hypothetical protein